MDSELIHKIFSVSPENFEDIALTVFRFQYTNNSIYRQFTDSLQIKVESVDAISKIPFLPIQFFKSHAVTSTSFQPETIFESSGTTGMVNSRHYIKNLSLYQKSFVTAFESFYGKPSGWCLIGLLPSYLERNNSSLIAMVSDLITLSGHRESGFYLNDYQKLHAVLNQLEIQQQKTMVIGVTFALLDFAEMYPMQLEHSIVLETGGMKGRRAELTRQEVHNSLQQKFGVQAVHSEYGMTELLSQAWSCGNGIFNCPGWMKVLLRNEDDPLMIKDPIAINQSTVNGIINVIDLANIYSCAFIATDDAGKVYKDGSFEVLGRIDNSDMRGCSLMVV